MPRTQLSATFGTRRKAVGLQRWRLAQLVGLPEFILGRIERGERGVCADEAARIETVLATLERVEAELQSRNPAKVA